MKFTTFATAAGSVIFFALAAQAQDSSSAAETASVTETVTDTSTTTSTDIGVPSDISSALSDASSVLNSATSVIRSATSVVGSATSRASSLINSSVKPTGTSSTASPNRTNGASGIRTEGLAFGLGAGIVVAALL
ncbi:hypothetical protein E1B28_013350 [Marasmius oreades]|uniref:Uncharacterized protein n=1 Tax=Marasmius oreades TaxID=181124 RepID=A0A9P7UM08_9AGAR|nr:uncharacterized protein E1B28_013350 [Marasmius oreades]KAG7087377.1 hypothetical protein E1B28_013350 [Marasmius oreades]